MNILYINHYAGSIYHGMEYRPYYLAREWVRQGHNVTIVASNFSHIRKKNIDMAANQNYLSERIDGINYIWCKTPEYGKNGIKRFINIFSFLNKVKGIRNKLIAEFSPDIVIASSTYPFDTKISYQIAKRSNAKFVYEIHDLWPLTPVEVGGMPKWHPVIVAMQRAENFGYANADKVVSLLPNADEYMVKHGMKPDKFVHISNGVVVDDWINAKEKMPNELQNLISRLRDVEKKFIVGYAGGMGESNALEYLLRAGKLLTDKPIAFVLVGDGMLKTEFQEQVKKENLTNFHFMPAISKLEVPSFLKSCDALYIGFKKLPIYRFGVCPNKLFDYMLAEKPIIHSVTAGNDIVKEADAGISIEAEDVAAIAKAIEDLTKMDKALLAKFGRNGYNYVLKNHDYRVLATRFLDSLNR